MSLPERLIVWGAANGRDLDSFRHINRHYHQTARKLGIQTLWLDDTPENRAFITPGSTVFAVDRWSEHLGLAVPGAYYVLHNFDGSHPLCQSLEDTPAHLVRIQVWTNDATGEKWDTARQFDHEARTLFQPWGSDLLAEEFLDPVFNLGSRDIPFVGAVWSDIYEGADLGNAGAIHELREVCAQLGLKFVHSTHVSDAENVASVRAGRLAPAFAGGWQCGKNYLPCRAFKNVAYGALAITNVPIVAGLFDVPAVSVAELMDSALRLRRDSYLDRVREQQRIASRYTYRQSLESIARAFEEIRD